MDRRTFPSTRVSLGAPIALLANITMVAAAEIDATGEPASLACDLLEVFEYNTMP